MPKRGTYDTAPRCAYCRALLLADEPVYCRTCCRDSLTNGVNVGGIPLYVPTPAQLKFHRSKALYPLYGGAMAGGKSHALRWHFHMSALTVPHSRWLLLRRHKPDLERTHWAEVQREVPTLGATLRKHQGLMEVRYPNGAVLEMGHCQHAKDIGIYLSAQYDGIGFDELVTFEESQYVMIRTRARTVKPGLVARVLAATNPGGPESAWVMRRWIDRDITAEEDPSYDPADYAYLPATLDDNPFIDRVQYDKVLGGLPKELAKAYRYGNWHIFPGQYFQEFRTDLHAVERTDISPSQPRWCGLDWGYSSEGVCYWLVRTLDGGVHIEDEYVFNGPRRPKQIVEQVAAEIRTRSQRRGITVAYVAADPAIFSPHGHIGETIGDSFRRFGVPVTPANHDRVNGWARMRAWLKPMSEVPGGPARPWLTMSRERCPYLVRTLPAACMDPKRPEDVDTTGQDHGIDTVRYALMSVPHPTGEPPRPVFGRHTAGYLKQQILAGSRTPKRRLGRGNVRRPTYAY